ncbi:glycosyl hydrolase family 39 [Niastella vici]|uniref:Glycosyl hydrolase family 39 n=1 Tax=Niastella vici TaxID=1703345 RepID=A0A1V9FHT8_9BACT|nr:glycosyl hydrolase family 39 [Niastella vici]OQP57776.1 glycosyl hydrolase family 39 [Niastella vici]
MNRLFVFAGALALVHSTLVAQTDTSKVTINWDKQLIVSKTTATLQLVENPMVRPNSPIHKNTFKALKELGADYVRYVPWFPYPKMAVAELEPPTATKTYWDFTYLDSTMAALMEATKGHSTVINFSTTPAWMWKTAKPVKYPDDPYGLGWDYNQGTELRDTTMKELAGYFARLFSWYTKGGFTDELGVYHKSGHYYDIPYWEVLNEPDLEHHIPVQLYTKMYDAIVGELKKISSQTKFIGLSLAYIREPEYFEYFLNPNNHKPGIQPEGISYHHYSRPSWPQQTIENYQYTFFEQAESFLDKLRYIESIRKRLAPQVFTTINEIGVILRSPRESGPIPDDYWNLAGAMYAYIFLELIKLGIEVAGESQLVGYPTQFPDVSMMNWENGNPNARYWVLRLLKENFGAGDILVNTSCKGKSGYVIAQAIKTKQGKKVLLINKHNTPQQVLLPQANNRIIKQVDVDTRENPPAQTTITGNLVTLKPFSVAVVEIKD